MEIDGLYKKLPPFLFMQTLLSVFALKLCSIPSTAASSRTGLTEVLNDVTHHCRIKNKGKRKAEVLLLPKAIC